MVPFRLYSFRGCTSHLCELSTIYFTQNVAYFQAPLKHHSYTPDIVTTYIWPSWYSAQSWKLIPRLWHMASSMILILPGYPPTTAPTNIPQFTVHICIAHECHSTSIRLAAQIWGAVRCANYNKIHHCLNHQSLPNRTIVTLPSHLSRILPPSPSYPSFSILITWSLHFPSLYCWTVKVWHESDTHNGLVAQWLELLVQFRVVWGSIPCEVILLFQSLCVTAYGLELMQT